MKTFLMQHAVLGAAAALVSATATADEGQARSLRVPFPAKYRDECTACHIAYPPGLLPAEAWRRLMSDLPRHFGTDTSLDPATQKEIAGWLDAHAGSYKKVLHETMSPPDDRITRSRWFVREHHEVAPATWKLPAVKSPSNCSACHRGADRGDFIAGPVGSQCAAPHGNLRGCCHAGQIRVREDRLAGARRGRCSTGCRSFLG